LNEIAEDPFDSKISSHFLLAHYERFSRRKGRENQIHESFVLTLVRIEKNGSAVEKNDGNFGDVESFPSFVAHLL
jgi:hypothetical protein